MSAAELGEVFDGMSERLQRDALCADAFSDADQYEADVSLAMIGRVRAFLRV